MTSEIIYPVMALRDLIMFPGTIAPLFVGREKSLNALTEVMKGDGKVIIVAQKEAGKDNPTTADLYNVGVLVNIIQMIKLPDNTTKLLVEASTKVKIHEFHDNGNYFEGHAEISPEAAPENFVATEALLRSTIKSFDEYVKLSKKINPDLVNSLSEMKNSWQAANTIATNMPVKSERKQRLLEIDNFKLFLESLFELVNTEIDIVKTEGSISKRVEDQIKKNQRDYYLKEQMQAIHKELGDGDSGSELKEFEDKINKLKLTKEAKEKALGELRKLKMTNVMSAEASISRNYLELMLSLPWSKNSKLKTDIAVAEKVLDRDHFGLEKVKERIIEYLAVQQRIKQVKGSILCFVGPPGVGKTSLAKSIAEATGRKYVRIALGGVRDEAEIRGHRKTYIGAMPGKILQSMKKAGTSNPLFLLDELDKLGMDYRGDPAAALLEVLDPEQNKSFIDHYLEVEYDLSNVMFIATANSYNMPRPLMDRMEIINLSGYIEDEKLEIAKTHLISKQIEENGLKPSEISISDAAIRDIINYYTREAGVRSLERVIAKLCRKVVRDLLKGKAKKIAITPKNLEEYLGVHKYNYSEIEDKNLVGVTNGLAYTEVGGDILAIEAITIPGKGEIKITGKLGEVMQESAQAAFTYFCSKAESLGVPSDHYQKRSIHIHVPEGATPKDGPSAGIALFTTIASAMTGIPVKRNIAMTGEITLRGRVLAIGGLKEKLMAALRGGIDTVIIPEENIKDLKDIPTSIKSNLQIIPVKFADEVLKTALESYPKALISDKIAEKVTKIEKNLPNEHLTH